MEINLKKIFSHIYQELKNHVPFTLAGAVLGVVFMLLFTNTSASVKESLFKITHPAHVILSAIVTASMFKLHSKYKSFIFILIIGWAGSIGIATLSDIIIPHILGTELLGLNIPVHQAIHEQIEGLSAAKNIHHELETEPQHHPGHTKMHIGFIEEWYIVNPAAILGILLAWRWPHTKIPHAGHILLSTWASCAYVLMTATEPVTLAISFALVIVLFISVWFPCCFGDIIFPLFFTGTDTTCPHCLHISHRHHKNSDTD